MSAGRVLSDFRGCWRFERDIRHSSGDVAQATGTATFTDRPDGLIYEETAQLSLNRAPPLTATRRYLWGQGLRVWFEDGRVFHDIPPTGGSAEHWCDLDTYRVTYDFDVWPRWRSEWRVTGPRKDYVMRTAYCR